MSENQTPQAEPGLRFFIAGIMQGSHCEAKMHDQDYRGHLKQLLLGHFPDAQVYDPLADHSKSLYYGKQKGRDVFFEHNRVCQDVDVLVAFVPQASMGTAIEMWEAYTHGAVVITISPLAVNWAVRFLSHLLFEDVAGLERSLASGELVRRVMEIRNSPQQPSPPGA